MTDNIKYTLCVRAIFVAEAQILKETGMSMNKKKNDGSVNINKADLADRLWDTSIRQIAEAVYPELEKASAEKSVRRCRNDVLNALGDESVATKLSPERQKIIYDVATDDL